MYDDALELAAQGWPVFPLRGKRPMTKHGFRDATTNEETVRSWWARWPKANIGASVPPAFAVIDVDGEVGLQSLRDLADRFGPIPDTLTVETGSGGQHLYFLHPRREIRQGAGVLAPGIDTRMPGKGYVVLPPSIHPETGRAYAWVNPSQRPAEMPGWMVAKLRPKPARPRRRMDFNPDGRLAGLCKTVAQAPVGQRNHLLNWAAYRARDLDDKDKVVYALTEAARAAGLEPDEIPPTIRSGLGI